MSEIKDSGNRREFSTGAVRDMAEGKGRCDLLPLDVISTFFMKTGIEKFENASNVIFFLSHALTAWEDIDLSEERFDEQFHEVTTEYVTEYLYSAIKEFFKQSNFADIPTMILELSVHFEQGAIKYEENNWKRGIPVNCYIDSAIRHYLKWLRGDTDERHDRAFIWNIVCCIWEVKNHGKGSTDENKRTSTDNAESGSFELSAR